MISEKRELWAQYFFSLAEQVAKRSACCRRKVGAIVTTKDKRIIGTGYNGAPPGLDHCTKKTCIRLKEKIPSGQQLDKCKAVHAEVNAVLAAGSRINEIYHIFVTNQPCISCLKILMSLRVPFIHWLAPYPDKYSLAIMDEYGKMVYPDDENNEQRVLMANFVPMDEIKKVIKGMY